MTYADEVGKDFKQALKYGTRVRFRYFNESGATAGYDDDVAFTTSGSDVWVSGLILPIHDVKGSYDSVLLEQGRITQDDSKLYVAGSIETDLPLKIGVGSPPDREYSIIQDGIQGYQLYGEMIYKKIYMRVLPTGSIKGE